MQGSDCQLHDKCNGDATTVSRFSPIVGFSLAEDGMGCCRQSTADYSKRSDFMGSVRTACRAGIKHAAVATNIRAKATLA